MIRLKKNRICFIVYENGIKFQSDVYKQNCAGTQASLFIGTTYAAFTLNKRDV